jgi:epoxyqueuosine reductase
MHPKNATDHIKRLADSVGFDKVGIARAGPAGRRSYIEAWLSRGYNGSMEYLNRNLDTRLDPRRLLNGAASVIVVAVSYHQRTPEPVRDGRPRGRIAMYAWGDDYHMVVKAKLFRLADLMREELPGPFATRACVDTAPLLERAWAETAGIGWIGKNTMVIHTQLGSHFVLGALVTTLELEPDEPAANRCGTCTACVDACPTQALSAPYRMNASRCISYLTIEHRSDIDEALRPCMGDWIFGCDVCQEVCPHNRHATMTSEPRFAIRPPAPEPLLGDLLGWTPEEHRRRWRGSAVKRATPAMLVRNASIALWNENRRSPGL